MRRGVVLFWLILFALALPAGAWAQRVGAAVVPDTVLVGDVFEIIVRVELPSGHRAVLPDSIPVAGDVESAGRRRDTTEPMPDGGERLTAVYPLAAWRPGDVALPALAVRIVGPGGERSREVALPSPVVRSVLPADTAGAEPRPPKDVFGPDRTFLPLLLALLVAAAIAGAFLYWWRTRRANAAAPAMAFVSPKERALAVLDDARERGLVEAGDVKAFYTLVSGALRGYLAETNPRWGVELTTAELQDRARHEMPDDERVRLVRVLEAADLVKFAKRRPSSAEAYAEWESARAWVEAARYGEPAPEAEAEDDTAAGDVVAAGAPVTVPDTAAPEARPAREAGA